MAVAFTNSGNYDNASATSHTVAFNITGGDFVAAWIGYGSTPTASTSTYDGDTMIEYGTERSPSGLFSCWAVESSSTGTNNFVFTPTAAADSEGIFAAYSGVDQTTPVDHASTEDETVAAQIHSASFTTNNDDSMMAQGIIVDCGGACNGLFTGNAGAGQNEREILSGTHTGSHWLLSDEIQPSAGAETMTWSWSVTNRTSYGIIIEINEAAGAAGPTNLKTWNTVTSANVKTGNTVAIADIKTIDTVA